MAKGTVIVAVCCLVIIILFCIMLYLMSTVNPPEEFNEIDKKFLQKTTSSSSEPPDEAGRRSGGMFFDDTGVPIVDTAQYGLEKIDTDVIDFYGSTKKPALKYQNKDRKVIPPLWPRASQEIIVNPNMHKVMPPIWPTTSVIIDTVISSSSSSIKQNTLNNTTKEEITPTTPNVKAMKRRSVRNYILDEDASSVILKILDHNGQSKIEIKIWSDIFLQKRKDKAKGTTYLENKSNYTLNPDKNVQHKIGDGAENTVVTICANDSVVIEESKGTNVTELFKSISLLTTTDDSDSNITNLLRVSSMNNTDNGDKPTELLLVNQTKGMGDIKNSSDFEVTSNSNMSITKHEISSSTMKNSSDFDIFSNTKTNVTEFNKMIFNEETNIVTADSTRVNAVENNKISISDIYPSNYTDLFIESDNDMVY